VLSFGDHAESLPELVLPPMRYSTGLAPCAAAININARIMEAYLVSILPGRRDVGCAVVLSDTGHQLTCQPNAPPSPSTVKRLPYTAVLIECRRPNGNPSTAVR